MAAESLVKTCEDTSTLLTLKLAELTTSYSALPNKKRKTTAMTTISTSADSSIYKSDQLLRRLELVEKSIKSAFVQCNEQLSIDTPYQFEKPRARLSDLTTLLHSSRITLESLKNEVKFWTNFNTRPGM
jgi:hypothetical protein